MYQTRFCPVSFQINACFCPTHLILNLVSYYCHNHQLNRQRAFQVEGALTVQPLAYEVGGFKEYFLSLTPFNNARNPWFVEYWEQHFQVIVTCLVYVVNLQRKLDILSLKYLK